MLISKPLHYPVLLYILCWNLSLVQPSLTEMSLLSSLDSQMCHSFRWREHSVKIICTVINCIERERAFNKILEKFCYTCMKYTSSHIYKCINMINNAYFECGQHIVNLQNIILNPWIICLIIWKIILKEKKNKKCKFHNLNCIKKCFRVSN